MINLLQLISKKETKKEGLEKYFSITQKVIIYIPSTKNVNEKMTEEEHLKYVHYCMIKFTDLFGGSTAQKAFGSYYSEEKGYIFENVTKVYSLTNELTKEKEKEIEELAQWLKNELGQESVLVEIEPAVKGYFVE